MGLMSLMLRLMKRYPKLAAQLEWEGGAPVGGRVYDPHCQDPSDAGALAAALWELPLLTQHHHPHVVAGAQALLALAPGGKRAGRSSSGSSNSSGGLLGTAAGPQDLAELYSVTLLGGFKPAPKAPRSQSQAGEKQPAALRLALQQGLTEELQMQIAALSDGSLPDTQLHCEAGNAGNACKPPRSSDAATDDGVASSEDIMVAMGLSERVVAHALQRHYVVSRRYDCNRQLRQEKALLLWKLQHFQDHLIEMKTKQDAAAAAKAHKPKQAAVKAQPKHSIAQVQHNDAVKPLSKAQPAQKHGRR